MTNAVQPVTTAMIRRMVPFAAFLDVTFDELAPARVVARMPAQDGLGTIGGGVHGGAQTALADITAAVAAVLAGGDPTAAPATVQSSANFLRPAQGALVAVATVLRPGRSAVVDVEVRDESGELASVVRQVVAVRPPRAAG